MGTTMGIMSFSSAPFTEDVWFDNQQFAGVEQWITGNFNVPVDQEVQFYVEVKHTESWRYHAGWSSDPKCIFWVIGPNEIAYLDSYATSFVFFLYAGDYEFMITHDDPYLPEPKWDPSILTAHFDIMVRTENGM